MASVAETFEKYSDKIKDQEWYQQIETAYEQLPSDQQKLVKYGGLAAIVLVFLYFTWSMVSSANQTKSDYYDEQELLQTVNQASDEIKRLKGQNAGFSQAVTQNWKQVFQNLANGQGLAPDSIDILKETPGSTQGVLQETLVDVQIKAIALRQMVQMLFQVEHGNPPMKLRALHVEPAAADGLLTVKLSVSGFTAKPEKK